jgi:hypothetical protein
MLSKMRIPTLVAALGLFLAVAGWSLAASPDEAAAQNPSQICTANQDLGSSHGGCVSFVASGNLTAALADACRDPVFQAQLAAAAGQPVNNHGQCMKVGKEFFGI